ncbi:hypothetical protein RP319_11070 [Heyndrickxia coagulans]|uniref:hypothetical protein n=1 Tax=Heyndrickxia coagulans TaxID=1398 RepID=UPI0028FA7647|nr:hypothetical protein [Heyndrickxia coagulans]MDT9756687.1 hypothetical protein [Heyndrickxia coagulans]
MDLEFAEGRDAYLADGVPAEARRGYHAERAKLPEIRHIVVSTYMTFSLKRG